MITETPSISIVVPVFNEEDCLQELYQRVVRTLNALGDSFEFILVDDGSKDHSLSIIRDLCRADSRVKYLSFSRNFGHQPAIFAGLEYSCGAAVISLDADLQHPIELVPEMIQLWREGYEVVYTTKDEGSSLSPFRRGLMTVAYKLIRGVSGLDLAYGQSDFRLLDRKVVEALKQMPEKRKFLRGLVSWSGFKQIPLKYNVAPRYAGHSKYTYRKLFRLAFDGIFSFSIQPLRAVLLTGITVAFFCFIYVLYVLIVLIAGYAAWVPSSVPPGWLSIMMGVIFLGSVQLISIGILGEYIGRIYEETRERPLYLISETGGLTNHSLYPSTFPSHPAPSISAPR